MNIKTITWEAVLPIRHQVLWPSKPLLFCKVEGDEDAQHYGAYVDEKLVCVASIYIDGDRARLRKFATLADFQGQGIGTRLISHIIDGLKERGIGNFWCDARKTAIRFYNRFNMQQEGGEFSKSGVLYVKMQVPLLKDSNLPSG